MQFSADLLSALPPKADIQHCAANLTTPGRQFPADKMLPSGPVDITSSAIAFGSLIYQFGEAAAKLNIKNLFDALSAHAIIMHQRIKLAF
jgi:hypothetical protein